MAVAVAVAAAVAAAKRIIIRSRPASDRASRPENRTSRSGPQIAHFASRSIAVKNSPSRVALRSRSQIALGRRTPSPLPAHAQFSGAGHAPREIESDWSGCQIENQVAHQIALRARLGIHGCQIACCARLPDWALLQSGQIGLRARLPDWSFRQIGAFLPQTLVKPLPNQGA